jgi:diguanylate cyclase (GGDEF)-like protein
MRKFDRLFWIVGAVGSLATVILLITLFNWQGHRALVENEERADTELVNTVGNAVWPEFQSFLLAAHRLSSNELKAHPSQKSLKDAIVRLVGDTHVVKAKIFSATDGIIVFSTEDKQIGERHPDSPGLLSALGGKPASTMSHRAEFSGIKGKLKDINVVGTYLPYYATEAAKKSGKADVIFELYTNITDRIAVHENTRNTVISAAIASLTALFGVLFMLAKSSTKQFAVDEYAKKKQDKKIRHQAFHDAMTGLPNRIMFNERARSLRDKKKGANIGLLFIDLDRFKFVNDSLGHKAGDEVLKTASLRIKRALRQSDQLFRIGGDEFIAILKYADEPILEIVSKRIIKSMNKPFTIDEVEVSLSVSVGVALWQDEESDLEQMVRKADMAMYAAKRAGANQLAFYHDDMKAEVDAQVEVLGGLRDALSKDQFVLHYQPRVCAKTRETQGVEALLRWQHPTKGLLYPASFISTLEDSPLIIEVGAWVLESACIQLKKWHEAGFVDLKISVNVAARQFRNKDFVETVRDILQKTGASPHHVELEITESQLIKDLDGAAMTVQKLKGLGLALSIDDFGTGYSSLSYLQKLPIDCLKIDRTFVAAIDSATHPGYIAHAIISLAHNLQMTVVAEGVETYDQESRLREWGCEQLQGFLFCKAVSADNISRMLSTHKKTKLRQPPAAQISNLEAVAA